MGKVTMRIDFVAIRYVLDTEGWKGEVANWKIPDTKDLNPQVTSHWVAGLRAVHRGEIDRAREELEQLKQLRTKLSAYITENKEADASYLDRADVLEMQLNGMILIATKQTNEGINLSSADHHQRRESSHGLRSSFY